METPDARAPRPRRRNYARTKKAAQPELPAPGQVTMIRESTRRRLENPLMESYQGLLATLGTLRNVRKHREKQFDAMKKHLRLLQRRLFDMSADAHFLFHELAPATPAPVHADETADRHETSQDAPTRPNKRTRKAAEEEEEEEGQEEDEERAEEADKSEEDAPARKRRRTREAEKTEERVLRAIRKVAEETHHLRTSVNGMEVSHEREVQRKMRTQLEDMGERMLKRDREHDKLLAGWASLRMSKDARTFVAAHARQTPCRIQWSPMAAYDPPVDHDQATEAALRRRKPLTIATLLEEKQGKRAASAALHPSKKRTANKRVKRLVPGAEADPAPEGTVRPPAPAAGEGFDMSEHSAD